MGFFDELKDMATNLGRVGVEKGKQVAEYTKLNLANAAEEENIRKAYIEIGKLYYAERGMAPEAAYVALCEKITSSKITIEENKSRLTEVWEESGRPADMAPPMEEEPDIEVEITIEKDIPEAPAEENPEEPKE